MYRVGPGAPCRSVNATGDRSYEDKRVWSWRRQRKAQENNKKTGVVYYSSSEAEWETSTI